MRQVFSVLMLAGGLALLAVQGASAGGWAVVTLDAMPSQVTVNQPVTVGFMIRQHGQTPWVCDCVRVSGYHTTGEKFEVGAKMDEPGHYTATLNFGKAGIWQWSVASGLYPDWQAMPELSVSNPADLEAAFAQEQAAKVAARGTGALAPMLTLALGVLGLVGSGAGLLVWGINRRRLKAAVN